MSNFGFSSISISGALSYQGVWNAATNTPFLASGIGTVGEYYIVGTAGTTNLDGITDWQLGDWAIFSGSTWQKIDNSDSVTGNGATNELTYWTSPSAIASLNTTIYPDLTEISYVKGVTSGVQSQINGKVPTSTTISTSSPLSGGGDLSANRTLSISQSTTSTNGYLSSTDWNTFNNKFNLPALTNGSVLFSNGTTIAQNNANLNWDDANKILISYIGQVIDSLRVKPSYVSTAIAYLTYTGNGINAQGELNLREWSNGSGKLHSLSLLSGFNYSVPQSWYLPNASGTLVLSVNGITANNNGDITINLSVYVPTTRTITTNAPLSGGGDLSANRTLSISQSTTSTDGYLSSTDWNTFNNKQNVAPNVQSVISSATVTPTSTNDLVVITAQAAALFLANPTGSPNQGQNLMIRIKDNGTARTISYDTQYRAIGVTLPTTTVINKTLYLGLVYNSTDTKWDVIGVAQEA